MSVVVAFYLGVLLGILIGIFIHQAAHRCPSLHDYDTEDLATELEGRDL